MPERIQRQRAKGWRMPEGAVYVGRPSKWGNPFRVGKVIHLSGKRAGQAATVAECVNLFRQQVLRSDEAIAMVRAQLGGKDLACWCKAGDPCHADVLLELANERVTP